MKTLWIPGVVLVAMAARADFPDRPIKLIAVAGIDSPMVGRIVTR